MLEQTCSSSCIAREKLAALAGGFPEPYIPDKGWVWPDPVTSHNVDQEEDFLSKQMTFRQLQFKSIAVETLEDQRKPVQAFIHSSTKDNYIVKVDYLHHLLKCACLSVLGSHVFRGTTC